MRKVLGLTEKIKFVSDEKEKIITAKIDTGASSSSICKSLVKELGLGPVLRKKTVKQAHGSKSRPVIKAKLILKDREFNVTFTVADRKHMKYPVLIGVRILKKGNFLVDVSKQ